MSVSKVPSSSKDTSHWIRVQLDSVWLHFNLIRLAKTLPPNKHIPKCWGLGLQHIFSGGTIQPTAEGVMGKEEQSHSSLCMLILLLMVRTHISQPITSTVSQNGGGGAMHPWISISKPFLWAPDLRGDSSSQEIPRWRKGKESPCQCRRCKR